ncbi:MAG: DJ-1/PfpI family protein [Candidatus Saganbacteria bacterium]|nr:DJ-1/PfpI family protein [Candidatus Saganbacteria bacterium]
MKKAVLVIAHEAFRDEEYFHPKEILEKNGIFVRTVSAKKGACLGKLGAKAECDMALSETKASDFDGIFFIGGPGAYDFFEDKTAHGLLTDAVSLGKVVGGICAGAAVLAHAGILKGKKATSFSGVRQDLEKYGAHYTAASVEVDGKVITADGPQSAKQFGEAIVKALA